MKFLSKFLILLFLIIGFGCFSNEEVFVPMDKILDQGENYSIEDSKKVLNTMLMNYLQQILLFMGSLKMNWEILKIMK